MNRRISDLLDTYGDSLPELNLDTPLSPERIKMMTMKIIQERKPTRKRIAFRVLAAAAIIVALSVTVLAFTDVSVWIRQFYGSDYAPLLWHFENELEDDSVELLTEPVCIPAVREYYDDVIEITAGSVRLRPVGILILYSTPELEAKSKFNLISDLNRACPGAVLVVLQDGTVMEQAVSGYGRVSDDSNHLYWAEYSTEMPPLEEIEYIELPGGIKFTVPEQ